MAPLLFLAGLCLLALPGATRRFGRRLDPAEWSRLCLIALVAGAAAVEAAAILYGLPVMLRALGVTGLADACERTFAATLEGLILVPGLRRSTAALRAALERWADEAAAAEPDCSRQALRQALLGMATVEVGLAVGHFSAADAVLARLDALDREPLTPTLPYHAAVYVPGLVVAAAAVVGVGGWTSQVDHVLALAGTCVA